MFTNVIVPLDGSDFATLALPVGCAFADALGASTNVIGIARSDAELSLTYDHVHDEAKRAGLDAADVEIRVDPDPVGILLDFQTDEHNLLCLASHDHVPAAAKLMHAVGSAVIERARRPVIVVGTNVSMERTARDVVVAIDGMSEAQPLLAVAATWARALHSRLRIVTVYEPVPADMRNANHYTRRHGPAGDPEAYLMFMRERVDDVGLVGVDTAAIADPIGVAPGLSAHLGAYPGRLVVVGGAVRKHPVPHIGVARRLLSETTVPLLIVNRRG